MLVSEHFGKACRDGTSSRCHEASELVFLEVSLAVA